MYSLVCIILFHINFILTGATKVMIFGKYFRNDTFLRFLCDLQRLFDTAAYQSQLRFASTRIETYFRNETGDLKVGVDHGNTT